MTSLRDDIKAALDAADIAYAERIPEFPASTDVLAGAVMAVLDRRALKGIGTTEPGRWVALDDEGKTEPDPHPVPPYLMDFLEQEARASIAIDQGDVQTFSIHNVGDCWCGDHH